MPIIQAEPLKHFVQQLFKACGAPLEEAEIVADHLVSANLAGVDSHGVIRITQYVQEIRDGAMVPGAPVKVSKETATTAVVDGGWNFGQVAAQRSVECAIDKAREHHLACVLTQRCGHAGRVGAFTQFAAERGFIALAVCNSPRHGHFVLPWGGREGRLSTNPISFAIPTDFGYPIVADFSTASSAEGKIRLHRDEGRQLPQGWIVDAEGRPSTDPNAFYGPPRGAILPFGGDLGYRAYALSLLVEILGATLAGQDITIDRPGNDLACIVVDVAAFIPLDQFRQLVTRLRDYLQSSPPAPGFEGVLLPGEPEFKRAEARRQNGIAVDNSIWSEVLDCARSLSVEPPAEISILPSTR
jgi:uncharacterized oxidoreductase